MNENITVVANNGYSVSINGQVIYTWGVEWPEWSKELELTDDNNINVNNTLSIFAAKALIEMLKSNTLKWVYNRAICTHGYYTGGPWSEKMSVDHEISVDFPKYSSCDEESLDEHNKLYHKFDNALHKYFRQVLDGKVGFNMPAQYITGSKPYSVVIVYNNHQYTITVGKPTLYYAYNGRTSWELGGDIEIQRKKLTKKEA